ncbi:MAG: Hsp20/alpha crystallin family protein [Planctomycetota bacterium]
MKLQNFPLTPMAGFERDMSELFRGVLGAPAPFRGLDVAETETAYEVAVDLPGIAMEEVSLDFADKTLRIEVAKVENGETVVENRTWHRRDRRRVEIRESIRFPKDIEVDAIAARLDRGVLQITLPKAQAAQARRIAIQG